MSINWTAQQNAGIFPDGIKINELNPLQAGNDLTINHAALNVDVVDSNKSSSVSIKGSQFSNTGVINTNQINVDLIQERTNNQGVSIADVLKVDTVEESTTSARVSFPDDIKVDQIQSVTPGGNILFNNNVDIGNLRVDSINKLTSDLTINLGHTNSSNFTYFGTWSDTSIGVTGDPNNDFGSIQTLNIMRINNFVFCSIHFRVFASPQDSFGDTATGVIPSRFRPPDLINQRAMMTSNSATANNAYIAVSSSGGIRIGITDQDDSLDVPSGGEDIYFNVFWVV